MLEIGPKHNLEYRQEILTPLFSHIQSAESCYIVGGPSAGKTRLLDFLMRRDVQQHYLGDQSDHTWLIRVDMNRLPYYQDKNLLPYNDEPWAFYELLLNSFLLGSDEREAIRVARGDIAKMDSEVIKSGDFIHALRFFELAVNRLCFEEGLRLCFVFDEFDETYQTLPRHIFAQLRAVRDGNKNRMSYVIVMRNLPEELRPDIDNESFYELMSRNMLGLGPYNTADAMHMLQQLEARRSHPLSVEQRNRIMETSGGHAGFIQALMGLFIEDPTTALQMNSAGWLDWCCKQETIEEESRKIWEGLSAKERDSLTTFAQGRFGEVPMSTLKVLRAKGMLRLQGDELCFFSALFERFAAG